MTAASEAGAPAGMAGVGALAAWLAGVLEGTAGDEAMPPLNGIFLPHDTPTHIGVALTIPPNGELLLCTPDLTRLAEGARGVSYAVHHASNCFAQTVIAMRRPKLAPPEG